MFLTFLISLPNTSATLRSVHMENRSMAVGLQTMIARIFGSIPGPILFGHFIDNTCTLWRREDDSSGDISQIEKSCADMFPFSFIWGWVVSVV